jgi:murein DD-endopeptidase MepM/ murein hydrolase activator NlpD
MHERAATTRRLRLFGAAAGIASLCVVAMGSVEAAGISASVPETRIDDQVSQADDDLASANKKVNAVKAELDKAQAKLKPAEKQLANAQRSVNKARAEAARARAALVAAEAAILAIKGEIATLEAEISDLRMRIGALARVIYTSGGQYEELQILLDSDDPAQFAERLAAMRRVSQGNSRALDELAAAQLRLDAKLAEGKQLEQTAQELRNQAQQRSDEAQAALDVVAQSKRVVEQLIARRQAIVSTADSERDKVRAQYNALAAQQARIAEAARKAREKEQQKNTSSGNTGSGNSGSGNTGSGNSGGGTGTLTWPTPGYSVGGRTGPRVHPVYGYRSCHTGDDIGAPSGTPIRAAASGKVISIASGGAYGNHTLISHAGGLSTMYAHQSRVAVRYGQSVNRGQVIGYVGSTGFSTGPHLHFEVHINGVPYEPMGWFGGSKYRVSCA